MKIEVFIQASYIQAKMICQSVNIDGLNSARPETGKLGRDQGARKMLPQSQGLYFEDRILSATQISGNPSICGWALNSFNVSAGNRSPA